MAAAVEVTDGVSVVGTGVFVGNTLSVYVGNAVKRPVVGSIVGNVLTVIPRDVR